MKMIFVVVSRQVSARPIGVPADLTIVRAFDTKDAADAHTAAITNAMPNSTSRFFVVPIELEEDAPERYRVHHPPDEGCIDCSRATNQRRGGSIPICDPCWLKRVHRGGPPSR